jgi:hypothetical protein
MRVPSVKVAVKMHSYDPSPFKNAMRLVYCLLVTFLVLGEITSGTAFGESHGPYHGKYSPKGISHVPHGEEDYDVLHYSLDLEIDFEGETISGYVDIQAENLTAALDTLVLNLYENMSVDSVLSGGTGTAWTHQDTLIYVQLDKTYQKNEEVLVRVYYHGQPDYGGWASFGFGDHDGEPIVYSISWPNHSHGWWPCKDCLTDKATCDVSLTVPDGMVGVSNGTLEEVRSLPKGRMVYHWVENYPVTTYNICIAVTNYDHFSHQYHYSETESMPVDYYVYPEDRGKAEISFEYTVAMMEHFVSLFGEYPFVEEKYGMVEIPLSGGMEHQTITSYGAMLITGNHYYDSIIAHELAHSWWGNCVGYATWDDLWTAEGLATYCEALWEEHEGGLEAYLEYMQILDTMDFQGPLYPPQGLLTNTVYNKGAWVVHMLRGILGEDMLYKILRSHYRYPSHKYDTATTDEFHQICEVVSGEELDWFFDQWVYGEGRPTFLTWWESTPSGHTESIDSASGHLSVPPFEGGKVKTEVNANNPLRGRVFDITITLEQVQDNWPVFWTPLELTLTSDRAETSISIVDSLKLQEVHVTWTHEVDNVIVDRDGWLLKYIKSPVAIVTENLPDGVVGDPYGAIVKAAGGFLPYTWSVAEGALPDGLSMDKDTGIITGTPTQAGVFDFTLMVVDSHDPPMSDESDFQITITDTGVTSSGSADTGVPDTVVFALQLSPNPFNPFTRIHYNVPARNHVSLAIFDTRGGRVKTLVLGWKEPGRHQVLWNGRNRHDLPVPSGVYFCRYECGESRETKRILLLK